VSSLYCKSSDKRSGDGLSTIADIQENAYR